MKDIELDPLTRGLIIQLNHVTDGELSHLYKKAPFCCVPVVIRRLGPPVGEALAMGKAVIASGEGSLPEVGGDFGSDMSCLERICMGRRDQRIHLGAEGSSRRPNTASNRNTSRDSGRTWPYVFSISFTELHAEAGLRQSSSFPATS